MTDQIQIVYVRIQLVVEQIQLVYDRIQPGPIRIQIVYIQIQLVPDRIQIVYIQIQLVPDRIQTDIPFRGSMAPFERSLDPRRGFLNMVPPFEGLRPLEGWGVLLYSSDVYFWYVFLGFTSYRAYLEKE